MNYAYFAVEGQHDVAAIGRILTRFIGTELIKKEEKLSDFWKRLIPRKFPYKGDLLMRVPVPRFYQSEDLSVAIHSADSDSQLVNNLKNTMLNLDNPDKLSAIAIFCDADDKNPQDRCKKLIEKLSDISALSSITLPGQVTNGPTRGGIFILPDNINLGTLETVLLQCADFLP